MTGQMGGWIDRKTDTQGCLESTHYYMFGPGENTFDVDIKQKYLQQFLGRVFKK